MREVEEFPVDGETTVGDLVEGYSSAGSFGAGRLAEGVDVLAGMLGDGDCTVFMGLAGAMVPAGMRRIVVDLIRDDLIEVLVSTGANLSHDVLEGLGGTHLRGRRGADDEELRGEGVSRILDVYLGEEDFRVFEEGVGEILDEIEGEIGISRLLREIGKRLPEETFLGSASWRGVDVYCPGIQDSILGLQIWSHGGDLTVDAFSDMDDIMETGFESDRTGALLVGGGLPKNYVLQTMMTAGDGFDYAVQLTTDSPEAGGLSGATLEEAVSWGKVRGDAVTVYGDATITLPLMVSAARYRLEG